MKCPECGSRDTLRVLYEKAPIPLTRMSPVQCAILQCSVCGHKEYIR
jgi:Zn ribbon nucleic-acid-binding protein